MICVDPAQDPMRGLSGCVAGMVLMNLEPQPTYLATTTGITTASSNSRAARCHRRFANIRASIMEASISVGPS
jgi:hypothetical protein